MDQLDISLIEGEVYSGSRVYHITSQHPIENSIYMKFQVASLLFETIDNQAKGRKKVDSRRINFNEKQCLHECTRHVRLLHAEDAEGAEDDLLSPGPQGYRYIAKE